MSMRRAASCIQFMIRSLEYFQTAWRQFEKEEEEKYFQIGNLTVLVS